MVRISSWLTTTNGQRNEFHDPVKLKIASADNAGRHIGSMIVQKIGGSLAPSMRAASMYSLGSDRKNCRIKNVPNVVASPGTISPAYVLTQPSSLMIRNVGTSVT